MPQTPDRVYDLGQRFPIFPNPQFNEMMFAVAFGSGSSSQAKQDDDHIYVKSKFGIKVPFSAEPIPFNATVDAILDTRSQEFPPPVLEKSLLLNIGNMSHDLFKLGLLHYGSVNGVSKPIYTTENKSRLERLALVMHSEIGTMVSFPHVEDYYQSGLNYTRFLLFKNKNEPGENDLELFRKTITDDNAFKIDRNLARIGALEGAFYSVTK